MIINSNFISIASHELKTPITGLKLQAEIAKRMIDKLGPEALTPDRVKKIIDNFHNDIDRLKRLVDDILDITRISSGKLSMKYETINVDSFMTEVVERMSLNFPKFNQLVSVHMHTPVLVHWDSLRIEQVIINLMSNALRYGKNSNIELLTYIEADNIVISVKDHGAGMSASEQKKLFEKFKFDTGKKEGSGLGLGLYIAYEIVKSHGGRLELQSEPGYGSTFTVKLPPYLKL